MSRTLLTAAALLAVLQTPAVVEHRDPQGRFSFTHPRSYGTTSPGTNDGFGGRFAAVRFSSFPAPLGGELVLTTGFPFVDLQALGGLYDSIALEVFPDPLRRRIVAQLPRLTPANFVDWRRDNRASARKLQKRLTQGVDPDGPTPVGRSPKSVRVPRTTWCRVLVNRWSGIGSAPVCTSSTLGISGAMSRCARSRNALVELPVAS